MGKVISSVCMRGEKDSSFEIPKKNKRHFNKQKCLFLFFKYFLNYGVLPCSCSPDVIVLFPPVGKLLKTKAVTA